MSHNPRPVPTCLKLYFILTLMLPCGLRSQAIPDTLDTVFPRGQRLESENFTGRVWVERILVVGEGTQAVAVGNVTFAAYARLDWHSHPAGQRLIITEGTGYYQERGEDLMIVRKGDVVNCLPGVEHWHAATPDSGVTYLALTGDEPTQWLEPVAHTVYYGAGGSSAAAGVREELLELSKQKWQWMADRDADKLADLFHDQAMFVHMGGSWGKDRELEVIRGGGIHYKQADIHEASVQVIGNTAIVLNNITLLAVVGGNEVTNPFEVTEVYTRVADDWKLASLSFTRLMSRD